MNSDRERLAKAYRILDMEGLAEDTTRGHVTLRTADNRVYLKKWGRGFDEVEPDELVCVDMDGKLLEAKGRVHSEIPLHLEIFRTRPDIFSVVHVHPFSSILLSSVWDGRLRILTQNGMHFHAGVPYYESVDLIRTREQGTDLARIMGDKLVALMRNHGITVAGRTLEEAVVLTIDFEKAAREHLAAMVFPQAVLASNEEARMMDARIFNQEQYVMMFDFYCRKLERQKRNGLPRR